MYNMSLYTHIYRYMYISYCKPNLSLRWALPRRVLLQDMESASGHRALRREIKEVQAYAALVEPKIETNGAKQPGEANIPQRAAEPGEAVSNGAEGVEWVDMSNEMDGGAVEDVADVADGAERAEGLDVGDGARGAVEAPQAPRRGAGSPQAYEYDSIAERKEFYKETRKIDNFLDIEYQLSRPKTQILDSTVHFLPNEDPFLFCYAMVLS